MFEPGFNWYLLWAVVIVVVVVVVVRRSAGGDRRIPRGDYSDRYQGRREVQMDDRSQAERVRDFQFPGESLRPGP